MTNAHEIHALSGAYVVDALDPAERAQFEAHLASCSTCQTEVASLSEAGAVLGSSVEAEPPAIVRDRLLAEIAAVRPLPPEVPTLTTRRVRAVRRLPALIAAAAVLVVAGLGTVVWHQATTSGGPSTIDRVLQASDAKRVTVDLQGGASASVVRSISEGRAVLITRDMPSAPSHRVYELWLQTPAGTMVPAGLMDRAGSRTVLLQGDATNATAAGITVEPEGGSDSPTTEPVALFDLSQGA